MVQIAKKRCADGLHYEVLDFERYARELHERGIEPPSANYQIIIPPDIEATHDFSPAEWDEEVKRFFRLSPASGIPAEIIELSSTSIH